MDSHRVTCPLCLCRLKSKNNISWFTVTQAVIRLTCLPEYSLLIPITPDDSLHGGAVLTAY